MNDSNKYYIYGGLAILVIVTLVVIAVSLKGDETAKLTVNTDTGPVVVKDFTKNPVERLSGTVMVAEESQFQIAYFEKEQSFTIVLLSKPLSAARLAAEESFLEKLDTTEVDACLLKVSVMTIHSVDEQLAGQELGLSFCPGAITLP